MRNNYISYGEIVNYFGRDKIADRYKFLHDKMQEYINLRGLEDKLYVNEGLLQQAVMDYFTDLHRMKVFHRINKADMICILAYETYWILRRKPIQPMPGETDRRIIFCNEGFVTTLFAHEVLIPSDDDMTDEQEEILLAYLRELNYHLRYRGLDKKDIELMLYSFQTGQKLGGQPKQEQE